jgi:hypothetical protein
MTLMVGVNRLGLELIWLIAIISIVTPNVQRALISQHLPGLKL